LVAAQVACAMVVLIAAVMLGRSLRDLESAPLGYRTRDVLLASVEAGNVRRGPAESRRFFRALLDDLRTRSRGEAALVLDPMPGNVRWTRQLTVDGAASPMEVEGTVVSDGFFALSGVSVEAGREFTTMDDEQAQPAIIVNRTAASRLWPGRTAVGQHVRIAG